MEVDDLPDIGRGFSLGVSISASEDLGRLGLAESHVRLALGEVARAVLTAGGQLVYGGHLAADAYTSFLVNECERFRSRDRPFLGCISWSVHRDMSLNEIRRLNADIGLLGRYEFLDVDGEPMNPEADRADEPETVDGEVTIRALTGLRHRLSALTDARLLMGGKRTNFQGRMPGVVEEAILAMEANTPLFFAGGFGGAAADCVRTLELDPEGWLGVADRRSDADQTELLAAALSTQWDPASNGLTRAQNHHMAVSFRASEVASLMVLGMSKIRGG